MSESGDPPRRSPYGSRDERGSAESCEQPEVVELEIIDVLDLHGFEPRDVREVVRAYLDAAWERGFRSLRLIHGRGIGMQRAAVRKILAADPRVLDFGDAPGEHGGWGATIVSLRTGADPEP